jgi:hypothetical protein
MLGRIETIPALFSTTLPSNMSFFQRFPVISQIFCQPPLPIIDGLASLSGSPTVDQLPRLEVHKGTFHLVTIAAVQNLLFMMRIASEYFRVETSSNLSP